MADGGGGQRQRFGKKGGAEGEGCSMNKATGAKTAKAAVAKQRATEVATDWLEKGARMSGQA